jgi:hypothetical protein
VRGNAQSVRASRDADGRAMNEWLMAALVVAQGVIFAVVEALQ